MGTTTAYDEVRYPGHPFTQTHPDRLATHGRLFGLDTPDPRTARVLEVGCGDGANLLPLADALPGATFVGVDLAATAVAQARALAGELGLANVRLEALSLTDLDVDEGSFDYVIAHGVYSWVPEPVRDALLALCARALSPDGVAYVSYNTLPGGRLREILRDILLERLRDIDEPALRLAAARELLDMLRTAWAYDESLATLRSLATTMIEGSDSLLYHDTLSPENARVNFRDFVAHAGSHGLRFLAEANFWEMQVGWVPEQLRTAMLAVDDRIAREQELDILRMRTFRQTLLCHAGAQLGEVTPARLEGLAVASPAGAGEPAADGKVAFASARGGQLTTDDQPVIGALRRAGAVWPSAVAIADLWPPGASAAQRTTVCDALLRCYAGDLVTLHATPLTVGTAAQERPRASPIARLQARRGPTVTNLRHEPVTLDEGARLLLTLLDGTRDRAALTRELAPAGAVTEELVARRVEDVARRAQLVATL